MHQLADILVTDFEIWDDCPFRDRIPANFEIRRGHGIIVLCDLASGAHVEVEYSAPQQKRDKRHGDGFERYFAPAILALEDHLRRQSGLASAGSNKPK